MQSSRWMCGAFLGGCALLAASSQAASVKLYDSYGTTGGGEFVAVPIGFSTDPGHLPDDKDNPNSHVNYQNPLSFETFCLEKQEFIGFDTEYQVAFSNAAKSGGGGKELIDGVYQDPLDARTAYLYTQFIAGTLTGYNYGTGTDRVNSANALQKAIWFIEEEETTALSGLALSFLNLAQSAISGGTWFGLGNVQVMNLSLNGVGKQDQLVIIPPSGGPLVPTPGALVGALPLFAGLLASRRRRSAGQ